MDRYGGWVDMEGETYVVDPERVVYALIRSFHRTRDLVLMEYPPELIPLGSQLNRPFNDS